MVALAKFFTILETAGRREREKEERDCQPARKLYTLSPVKP